MRYTNRCLPLPLRFRVVSGQCLLRNSTSNLFISYLFFLSQYFYQYFIFFWQHFAKFYAFCCSENNNTRYQLVWESTKQCDGHQIRIVAENKESKTRFLLNYSTLKAGMVCLQCNNCVIHTLQRRALLTVGRYTNRSSFTVPLSWILKDILMGYATILRVGKTMLPAKRVEYFSLYPSCDIPGVASMIYI